MSRGTLQYEVMGHGAPNYAQGSPLRPSSLIPRIGLAIAALLLIAGVSLSAFGRHGHADPRNPGPSQQDHAGQTKLASIQTPDSLIEMALERAKLELAGDFSCDRDAPCGDASASVLDMLVYGDFEGARATLELLRREQRADGKIPHGTNAYDFADTTPLWLAALYEYWLQTADTGFVRESWPAIYEAYRWLLASDSDGDLLVDNTAGGRSHVVLDPQPDAADPPIHQDIQLAALSVESLRAVADLAAALGNRRIAREAAHNFELAWSSLEREYFLPGPARYAAALLPGGVLDSAASVWPAMALSLSLLETRRVPNTLDALASERRIGGPAPVPPVVVSLVALAEYNYHRPEAGLTALWSNARSRNPPATLQSNLHFIPADLFASALFRGLFGFHADAPRNSLSFAPHLPADWDDAVIRGYRLGSRQLDVEIRRQTAAGADASRDADLQPNGANVVLTAAFVLEGSGPPLRLTFAPALPPASRAIRVSMDGAPVEFERKLDADDVHVITTLKLDRRAVVSIEYDSGIGVVPVRPAGLDGRDRAVARVIRYYQDAGAYVLRIEGRAGRAYEVDLVSPRGTPRQLSEGSLLAIAPGRFRLTLEMNGRPLEYAQKEIRFSDP